MAQCQIACLAGEAYRTGTAAVAPLADTDCVLPLCVHTTLFCAFAALLPHFTELSCPLPHAHLLQYCGAGLEGFKQPAVRNSPCEFSTLAALPGMACIAMWQWDKLSNLAPLVRCAQKQHCSLACLSCTSAALRVHFAAASAPVEQGELVGQGLACGDKQTA